MLRSPLLALLAASALQAQAPAAVPPRAKVTGVVYDSLQGRPLAGATVLASGSAMAVKTDAAGRYAMDVDSLGAGQHTFSFFDPSLDSLGISPPTRTLVLRAGESAVLDLAMPSPATLVASVCPDSLQNGGRGLVIGVVRDAYADRPLAGALVIARWTEMAVGTNTIAKLPRAVNAKADANGLYRLCGVPPNTAIKAQARLLPKVSGWIDIALPPQGVLVQEFLVSERAEAPAAPVAAAAPPAGALKSAPSAEANTSLQTIFGTATLVGTVVSGEGAPLEGAQVALIGTNLSVRSDYKGAFRMSGLPAGTQTVEVRLLSYQPKRFVVNLTSKNQARLAAVLDVRAQVLDPVTVTANETTDIPGFDDRRAHATGTFFTHKQIMDASFFQFTDVFRQVPGMQVLFVDGQYTVVSGRGQVSNGCLSAVFWVDGSRYDVTTSNLDDEFKPTEIEAMEVYNGVASLPAQFQGPGASCGTVVVWTNRGHFKKKTSTDSTKAPSN